MAVTMNIAVFWGVAPCSPVLTFRYSYNRKMEPTRSSERLAMTNRLHTVTFQIRDFQVTVSGIATLEKSKLIQQK
jgi:hypothetical protein